MSGERPDLMAKLIIGAACDALHRQLIVRGYPYQIVYRIMDAGAILVVAIAHGSRRPDYWVAR